MKLSFNTQGYLYRTTTLTYEEFLDYFVTTQGRKAQVENALPFIRIFYSSGCRTVYVDGSFVSKKKYPEDIDLCFDLTGVSDEIIAERFPEFFDPNEIGRIHRDSQCHILHFNKNYTFLFDILHEDRDGNPKGLVKLEIKDILNYYDQK